MGEIGILHGEGLLWFLLIGIAAGYVASKVMNMGHGLPTNLVVGVLGSFLGGIIAGFFGITSSHILVDLIVASIGAIILLSILRAVQRRR